MKRIITCEQVSAGHPDKICDQIADAIVTDCLQHDRNSRVAIECLFKNRNLVIAGELSSAHKPDYKKLVSEVFDRINNTDSDNPYAPTSRTDAGMDYKLDFDADDLNIEILVEHQSGDIALGVDKGGAGDQGMVYGYATNETPELLPIPFVVATKFLRLLKAYPCRMLKADAKAQVSFDYDTGKITTFLCSVQHVHGVEVEDFRDIIEKLMVRTATAYGLNTDFVKLVNPTGRFVIGSSFADCGVTGRKLACDTYGGIGHIGGGALSGKDPSKVDRSAAYMARKIARDIVSAGYADKAEVQIAYAIGVAEPVSVYVETFGTEQQDKAFIDLYVRENYDLTPRGIIDSLGLLDLDYNRISAYKCMHDSLADDGSIYVWHADTEGLNFRKAFKDAGFQLSGCCIWKKNSLVLGRSPYQWIHEPCLFGWKQKGKHQWYADRKQTTVWEYDKPKSSPDHPTTKPIPLMTYPIKNSTMTNGIVLDPFLGSGSTLIACCETERICRGIELDPKFVDVIVRRFQAWCEEHQTDADMYVLRDGQKLTYEEAVAAMPAEDGDADG